MSTAAVDEPGPGAFDERELEALYVKLEKPIFNVVYRWLWSAPEAQDVTQEAFVRLWRARGRIDPRTVEPLLYRTALNLAAHRRRAKRFWGWLGIEAASEVPGRDPAADARLSKEEDERRIRAAVDALPSKLKEVLLLTEFSEMSYEDVGAALGIPAGTVGSRRSSALRRLRERLGPEWREERP